MNDLFDDVYLVTKTTMQGLGLWPYQKISTRVIISTILFCDLISVTILMLWYVADEFSNRSEVIMCLPTIFIAYIAIASLVIGIVNVKKMTSTIEFMNGTWNNLRDKEELSIFKRYARASRLVTLGYFCLGFVAVIIFSLLPLISVGLDKVFPPSERQPKENVLKVNFFNLNPEEYYVPIYVYNVQVSFFVVFLVLAQYFYFVILIHHDCSMFAVLGYKIEYVDRLNCELHNTANKRKLDQVLSDEIKKCIIHHWDCIRFSELIEDLFKHFWFINIFLNSSLITIMAVQTTVTVSKPIYMVSFAINTSTVISLLFCITWGGQQLLNHSNQLSESIYNIDWYEFPRQSKQLLLIMFMRSSRPCKITAGGLIELNLETFCSFAKLSVSYFTLVLSTAQ